MTGPEVAAPRGRTSGGSFSHLSWMRVALAASAFLMAVVWAGDSAGPRREAVESFTRRAHPEKQGVADRTAHLRADVRLVVVPVTVTDTFGKPVNNLPRQSFRLLENGVEQTIASFSAEDAPVSVGFLVDSSGSMRNRIQATMDSLRAFFLTAVPGDEFFVVRFSDDARLMTGFVREPEAIYAALGSIQPQGWTALLDAVCLGVHQMKRAANPRKVLLVLSDGADNNSRYSTAEVKEMVREGDTQIYAIGLFTRPRLLQQIAEETGGRLLEVHNLEELPEMVLKLSTEIRNQYQLAYSSSNKENDGKYRKVKVELVQSSAMPPLHLSWRRGYYAPQD